MNKEYSTLIERLYIRLSRMIIAAKETKLADILIKLQKDLLYQSPELLNEWGDRVEQALFDEFGNQPDESWKKEVIKYWMEILDKDNNPYLNENITFNKLTE